MRNKNRRAALIATAMAAMSSIPGIAAWSDPALVDATHRYRHWSTLCTNEVPLCWSWTTNVHHARLNIAGMNGTLTTNFWGSVSNWVWSVSASNVLSAEDVYTLTLTFYAENDAAVGAMTSQMTAVTGAFGPATVNAVNGSRIWTRVQANTVLAYDANWGESPAHAGSAMLTIAKANGASTTHTFADTAGYTGWKLRNSGWGYGAFDLSLSFSGMTNEWTATLIRPMDGTAVSVR